VSLGDAQVTWPFRGHALRGARRRKRAISPSLVGYVIGAYAFLYLPLVMTAFFSFTRGATTRFPIEGFTFSAYTRIIHDSDVVEGLKNSVHVGIAAAICASVLAVPAALAVARRQQRGLGTVMWFVVLPLCIPSLIQGIALLSFFTVLHITPSLDTVILAHTLYTAPVIFLITRARLIDIDPNIHEAARDLGASSIKTFWRITLPLIRSAVLGAMLLAFALSFDEFVLAFFTIGPQNTLPLVVFSQLRTGLDVPGLSALMTMLVAITASVVIIASRFTRVEVGR